MLETHILASLRDRLARLNGDALRRIAQHWGIPVHDPGGGPDPEWLAARMAAETPSRTAFERLEPKEKEAVRAMSSAAHRGWVAVADLRRVTGAAGSEPDGVARSLEEKGVAFLEERELPVRNPYWGPTWAGRRLPTGPTPVLVLPEETAPFLLAAAAEFYGGYWHPETSPLNRLEAMPLSTLQAMARHYGVCPNGAAETADDLRRRLQPRLKDSAALWEVVQALPPHLRAVLDALEAAGGRLPMGEVRQRFASDDAAFHQLVAGLTERGLALDRFAGRSRVLLAPARVLECLAQHALPPPPAGRLQPVDAPPREERLEDDLQWSLLQLARHVRQEGLYRAATTLAVPKRVAERLAASSRFQPAGRTPAEWVEQQIHYLEAVEVLCGAGALHLREPEPAWLRQNAVAQARWLFERWLTGEVPDLRQHRLEVDSRMDPAALASGRRLLAELLRQCPAGQWMSLRSLLAAAAATEPFFLRDRDSLLRRKGYRGLKRMLLEWFEVEGRVLLLHLTGLPFELGMVALDRPIPAGGAAPPDAAFRLTEKGAAVLGTLPAPPRPAERVLVVQPDFEVVAMEFVPHVLDQLGQFALPLGYDRVASFRIERRQVNLALTGGWDGERVVAFLKKHARQEVPQNVEQTLRDWAAAIRRARFRRAIVVEADDPVLLEELARGGVLEGQARGLTRGAVLLVEPDSDIEAIARRLRQEGVLLEGSDELER